MPYIFEEEINEKPQTKAVQYVFEDEMPETQSKTAGQRVATAISNIPSDVAGIAGDVWQAVRHPVKTFDAIGDLAEGGAIALAEKLPAWAKKPEYTESPEDTAKKESFKEAVSPITKSIQDPKGIPGRFADYAEEHPVRAAINTSLGFKAASGTAKLAGAEKTAGALEKVAEVTSPTAPITGANKVLDKIPYVRAVKPSNWLPAVYQRAKGTPLAKEGMALEKSTGIDLTPAQKTGNRFLNYLEQTARDAAATADDVRAFDIKQANQAIDAVNRTLNKIGKGGKGSETIGLEVQSTVHDAVALVKKARRQQADIDYGAVHAIAGDKPLIRLKNLKTEVQNIINDFDVPGGEPIAKKAKAILSQIDKKQSITKAMNIRRVYSEASRGTGNIFGDLDKAQSRALASRLTRAIESDFEAAPTTVQGFGNLKQALQEANNNYRTYSQHINAVESSVLGKMLGKDVIDPLSGMVSKSVAPEKVASKLISMHPSELRAAKDILAGKSPETWDNVRRYAIEQSLEKAMDIPPSAGMNPIPVSTSKFINQLPAQKNLELFLTKAEMQSLTDIQKAMVRMGDRTAANTSKTAIIADLMDWLTPKGATKAAGRAIGLKAVTRAMTTPEGRAAIQDMVKARQRKDSARYRFLKDALITEYAVGMVENRYDSINAIQGVK